MQTITTEYDQFFQRYTQVFFASKVDWILFKAQAMAESTMNPNAVSPCGAVGLMGLMPGTSAEMARRLDCEDDPTQPHLNIMMGIGYDLYCYNIWKKEISLERLRFMFASYNAGIGNILRAQKLAKVSAVWSSVAAELPRITGDHAKETTDYVPRIEGFYAKLGGSSC